MRSAHCVDAAIETGVRPVVSPAHPLTRPSQVKSRFALLVDELGRRG
jgi:hypothetical protein